MTDIAISYGKDCVTVVNSCRIKPHERIESICKAIVQNADCPDIVRCRGVKDIAYEWMAHNLLYDLRLWRSHTASVDIDKRRWFNFAYWILGFIYKILH